MHKKCLVIRNAVTTARENVLRPAWAPPQEEGPVRLGDDWHAVNNASNGKVF